MRLRALVPLAVVLAAVVVLAVWGGSSSNWWPVLSGRPPAAERSPGSPGPAQSVREPPADAAGAPAASRPAARPTATPVPTPTPRPTPTPVPVVLRGRVVAADTGEPVADALVGAAGSQAATRTDAEGTFTATVPAAPGRISVSAPGFHDGSLAISAGTAATVALAPSGVSGTVEDAFTGRPLGGVAVTGEAARQSRTDADGTFRLAEAASLTVSVSAGAYEPATIRPASRPQRVRLTPREVRGLYLTFFGVGDRGLRENALALMERSEVNAVVVDIKGDRGWIAYRSEVPLAERIGAVRQVTIPDVRAFLREVHARGGLAIARIVVFKDDPLARARPDLAVRDARAGGPWVDGEGLAWTDPFRSEVWEYNVALAVEAARLGFDEIQYDYVRFPTDPSAATSVDRAVYSQPNDEPRRVAAIAGLLRRTQEALRPYPVRLSVDVFGYTTWHEDDMGIGQDIEALAPYLDVLAPMVYPSTYGDGLPLEQRYVPAARYPYEIVNLSVRRAVERLRRFGTEVRPWLQYFNDYTAASVPYGAAEIEAQKRATRDAGGRGWMFWDPTNRYAKGGFARRG